MGKAWDDQTAKIEFDQFLIGLREQMYRDVGATGVFNIASLDHNSENYKGVSNKRLKIFASKILGRRIPSHRYRVDAVPLIMARALGLPDPVDQEGARIQTRLDELRKARTVIDDEIEQLLRPGGEDDDTE